MPLLAGGELARRMVDRLYAAKNVSWSKFNRMSHYRRLELLVLLPLRGGLPGRAEPSPLFQLDMPL